MKARLLKIYEAIVLWFSSVEGYWRWNAALGLDRRDLPFWLRSVGWRLTGVVPTPLPSEAHIPEPVRKEMEWLRSIEPLLDAAPYWRGASMQLAPNHLVLEGEIFFALARNSAHLPRPITLVCRDVREDLEDIIGIHVINTIDGLQFCCFGVGQVITLPSALASTIDINAVLARLVIQMPIGELVVASRKGLQFMMDYRTLLESHGVRLTDVDPRGGD